MSINHWCSLSIWFKKIKLKNKGPEFKIRNLPLFGRRSSSHHHFWPITRLILVTVWPSIDIGNMTFTVLPGSPALHALFLHPPPHPGTQTSEGLITYLPLELPWLSLCLLHRTVWKQTHISHYSFPCSSPFIILILTPTRQSFVKILWIASFARFLKNLHSHYNRKDYYRKYFHLHWHCRWMNYFRFWPFWEIFW